jgi:hypothetical protein
VLLAVVLEAREEKRRHTAGTRGSTKCGAETASATEVLLYV